MIPQIMRQQSDADFPARRQMALMSVNLESSITMRLL